VASPLFGLMMNMEVRAILATSATLLAGTPAIACIGATGAAVAVALPRGGLLISVIVLPLVIPVLIFGVSAAYAAVNDPDPFWPPFMILCALSLFFAVLGPIAAAAALRWSAE
jgi:heme exporter protein B